MTGSFPPNYYFTWHAKKNLRSDLSQNKLDSHLCQAQNRNFIYYKHFEQYLCVAQVPITTYPCCSKRTWHYESFLTSFDDSNEKNN